MALFKISKGSKANLPATLTEGFCWYTYDDSKFYIDHKDEDGNLVRKALNAQDAETLSGASLATILNSSTIEIPTSQAVFDALETLRAELTGQDVVILHKAQMYTDTAIQNIGLDAVSSPQVSITYSQLKSLRDSRQLIPGVFYRITDYVCTTSQEGTRAMNHKFDIIVQALSNSTLSENASADYNGAGTTGSGGVAKFIDSVLGEDNSLVEDSVIPYYYEYIDYEAANGEGLQEGYNDTDIFVAYDYLENNEGVVVPVLYKTDLDLLHEGPDYLDKFFYVGTATINGETYDKWRKIVDDADHDIYWDSVGKAYVYTNVVVSQTAKAARTTSNATFDPAVIAEEGLFVEDTVLFKYKEIIDCVDFDYDGSIVDVTNEKYAVAYDYLPNQDGVTVPVIYSMYEDEIDVEQPYYYIGRVTLEDGDYDKWRKIAVNDNFDWGSVGQYYAYTNVIINTASTDVVDTYFKNANIPAWEIKYCLDNDDTRFTWADVGVQQITNLESSLSNGRPLTRQPANDGQRVVNTEYYYAWGVQEDVDDGDNTNFWYSLTEVLSNGDIVMREDQEAAVVVANSGGGKGVIYYMKDEYNNECPYDFKNIQFIRPVSFDEEGLIKYDPDNGEATWCYTFGGLIDRSIEQEGLHTFNNNSIGTYYTGCDEAFSIPNNVFLGTSECMTKDNKLGTNCTNNTFGNQCQNNIFGNGCHSNTFVYNCSCNIFADNNCHNTFRNGCGNNTFGSRCLNNTFGDYCSFNTFGNDCGDNTFGNECSYNTFGNGCSDNTFGDSKTKLIDNVQLIKLADNCSYINLITQDEPSIGSVRNITVSAGISGSNNVDTLVLSVSRNATPVVYEAAGTTHIILD